MIAFSYSFVLNIIVTTIGVVCENRLSSFNKALTTKEFVIYGHSSNVTQAGDIQEQPVPHRIKSEVRRSDQRARMEKSASEES